MPDPTLILEALAIAAAVAGLAVLAFGFPWRSPHPARSGVGWVIGLGGAFYVACRHMTGVWPHWPPRDGAERLLALILPAVLLVELLAALPPVPRWLAWALRLAVAAATAPVLLYKSIFLTGTGPATWSSVEAVAILGGLGAALAGVWALLGLLLRLAPGRSLPLALSVVSAATGAAIMLSGDFTDGRLGLPLAAALAGAAAASLTVRGAPGASAGLGVGLVGLFALLVIGRFFAGLTTEHAILLGLAPLLCWLPELPYVRRVPLWARGLARLALVAAPLALVVAQAQQQFVKNSASPSTTGADEPTIEDYMNFGK
jgi:hypothetical protein